MIFFTKCCDSPVQKIKIKKKIILIQLKEIKEEKQLVLQEEST